MSKILNMTLIGGVVFWLTTFAISLTTIAAEYRAAFSIDYVSMILVESVLAGVFIAGCVSYALIRFYDKIPTERPILKSMVLSVIIFCFFTIMIQLGSSYLVGDTIYYGIIGVIINVPRFLLLGVSIGYVYRRLN